MTESKIETTTGMCVVALTKYIMEKYQTDYESAYKKLLLSELYKLLVDRDTNLYLEPNTFLYAAYEKETESGKEALYDFINE